MALVTHRARISFAAFWVSLAALSTLATTALAGDPLYDGVWSQLSLSPNRTYHSVVYDSHRQRLLMFGGYDGQSFNGQR